MPKTFLPLLLLMLANLAFSQDKIFMNDGRVFDCKIQTIDSVQVTIRLNSNKKELTPILTRKIDSLVWFSNIPAYTLYLKNKGKTKQSNKPEFITGNYLYINKYQIIKGNNIDYKTPFIGSPYFLVDGVKHSDDMVRFYQNTEGFFANLKYVKGSMGSSFSRNIRKSRISLFSQTTYNYTGMHMGYSGGYSGGFHTFGGVPTSYTKYYYNKGYNDLKKVNYENLSNDMADDPLALAMLYKYEKTRKNGNIFMAVSGGLIGVGFASLLSKISKSDNPNVNTEMVVISIGTIGMWIKYFGWDQSKNPENIKQAIDTYNR